MTRLAAVVPSLDIREAWKVVRAPFAQAAQAGAGFSFRYCADNVGPQISDEWRQAHSRDTPSGVATSFLTHPSGLVVRREARVFADFGAVEYRLHFKNAGKDTLPPVSALQALNLSFDSSAREQICVVSSGGGMNEAFLPPRTFAIRKNCFTPTAPDNGVIHLTTEGGRSSDKDLPFFFVHNETLEEGLFVAFGWSGQWEAFVSRNVTAGTLTLRGSIPGLDIALEPGEEIDGPTVLIGFYQGEVSEGSNRLRRLIRDVYTPKLAGKSVLPMAVYDHWWNIEEDFDEPLLKQLADGAAALDQEYFLLDAGWYAHPDNDVAGWVAGTGNWEQIHATKLPNGLKPIADYVRTKGLKFGLWFEPERVARGTQLANEHPDWILWDHGVDPAFPALGFLRHLPPDSPFVKISYGLLDYGRPEVRHWVCNLLDRYIRDYGIQYIRYDFNLAPLAFWNAHDKPGRYGITQLRHIQGFYAIVDWVRERHPDTVLEGCASGGRRIDLETARRFHTFLISDHNTDPSIVRFHLFGIHYFLPGNYYYVPYVLPTPNHKDFQPDDIGFQSLFGGAFGTGGYVDRWPEEMKRQARVHIATWKKLRRYLNEDYYPLSDQPGDLKSWSGWQFHDPKDQSGFVQTFRTKTASTTHRFFIHKLDERARYRFTDAYGAEIFEVTGATAMTQGIEMTQEPMSSQVLMYKISSK